MFHVPLNFRESRPTSKFLPLGRLRDERRRFADVSFKDANTYIHLYANMSWTNMVHKPITTNKRDSGELLLGANWYSVSYTDTLNSRNCTILLEFPACLRTPHLATIHLLSIYRQRDTFNTNKLTKCPALCLLRDT